MLTYLDLLVVSDSDTCVLVTALAVVTRSSLFFVVTVAEILANEMSRSIVRSIPCCDVSVRNLPELKCLSTTFEGDEFLS